MQLLHLTSLNSESFWFDSVWRIGLWRAMRFLGHEYKLVRWLGALYKDTVSAVRVDGDLSLGMLIPGKSYSRVQRRNSRVSMETLNFARVRTFYQRDRSWIAECRRIGGAKGRGCDRQPAPEPMPGPYRVTSSLAPELQTCVTFMLQWNITVRIHY